MARNEPITAAAELFTKTDHVLQYTIYDSAAVPVVVDITGWALTWILVNPGSIGSTPLISKTVGSGIAITNGAGGVLQVTISDTDSDALTGRDYWYELRRTDAGSETVLAYGPITFLQGVS
jgi:hypothetical protein